MSLNQHFRNFATWRGCGGNRSFAVGLPRECS